MQMQVSAYSTACQDTLESHSLNAASIIRAPKQHGLRKMEVADLRCAAGFPLPAGLAAAASAAL